MFIIFSATSMQILTEQTRAKDVKPDKCAYNTCIASRRKIMVTAMYQILRSSWECGHVSKSACTTTPCRHLRTRRPPPFLADTGSCYQ